MPYVELLPVPKDASLLINYLSQNFRRIADGLIRSAAKYAGEDIEITSSSKGVILTAPNGNRYRLVVSNTGVLTTVAL